MTYSFKANGSSYIGEGSSIELAVSDLQDKLSQRINGR